MSYGFDVLLATQPSVVKVSRKAPKRRSGVPEFVH